MAKPAELPRTRSPRQDGTWQEEKSRLTRHTILEGAISCFIEVGYTATTTHRIADRAGVSRGAMMHHFESRADVIKASAAYLNQKRLAEFEGLILNIKPQDQDNLVLEDFSKTIKAVWKFYNLDSFTAYHELVVASRTDGELAIIVHAMQAEFEQRILETIRAVFPIWNQLEDIFQLESDLVFLSLQGMAISFIQNNRKKRISSMLEHIAEEIFHIYQHGSRRRK